MITFDDFTEEELMKLSLLRGETEGPCMFCKTPTKYVEYCAEARICSPQCYGKLQDWYIELSKEVTSNIRFVAPRGNKKSTATIRSLFGLEPIELTEVNIE